MKKNYTNPEFKLIAIDTRDIMNASDPLPTSLVYAAEGGLEDSDSWVG
ncbi:MAG: hypothetical protein IJ038_06395 [Clostridia bacterium]|nr:hypothetical protein [Clostridia bacterium]